MHAICKKLLIIPISLLLLLCWMLESIASLSILVRKKPLFPTPLGHINSPAVNTHKEGTL